jgi:hypothetical protein
VQATTSLLRQVHPNHWDGKHLVSIAFLPKASDEGLLSVYDADQILPEESHRHYTETSNLQSTGVWAVTVEEAAAAALPAWLDAEGHYPEHAVIDFTAHQEKQRKVKARVLAAKAEQRGCLYQPPAVPPTA